MIARFQPVGCGQGYTHPDVVSCTHWSQSHVQLCDHEPRYLWTLCKMRSILANASDCFYLASNPLFWWPSDVLTLFFIVKKLGLRWSQALIWLVASTWMDNHLRPPSYSLVFHSWGYTAPVRGTRIHKALAPPYCDSRMNNLLTMGWYTSYSGELFRGAQGWQNADENELKTASRMAQSSRSSCSTFNERTHQVRAG